MEHFRFKIENYQVITVENNYRVSICPFCSSSEIMRKGNLNYKGKAEFSTHVIDLKYVPEIWKCKNCRSSFTQNAIKPADAEKFYASGEGSKRWSPKSFIDDKTQNVRDCLDKYLLNKNARLLDVGCNTGEFLDYAAKSGIKTYGLELCEQSCEIVNGKGHKAFRTGEEIKETFDLITGFDVFEHLYDPNGFLSFIHGLLNKDGILILITGNPDSLPARISKGNWWYFNYPEHVIYPSPNYFNMVKGFRVIETMNVFASLAHDEHGFFFAVKNFIKILIGKNYSGRPAIVPDHQLVVLQKN